MKSLLAKSLWLIVLGSISLAQMAPMGADAASWDTWIADTDAIAAMVEAPSEADRESELLELIVLAESRDEAALQQISYWNTASPSYRWLEILNDAYKMGPPNPLAGRAFALMTIAIYDATVSTWKAKYADGSMGALSPASFDDTFEVLVPTGHSPSFPSEHASVAVAASEILAYVQPDAADKYRAMAEEAMQSRLLAGANFQSDIEAARVIGQAVAEEIIAWAMADGSDAPWDYTRPEESLFAVEEPVFPVTGTWKTWAIDSGSQFRAPPPPAYDSAELAADLDEIKAVEVNMPAMHQATNWATFYSAYQIWYDFANKLLFEQRQADNAPYMALIYAGLSVAQYDAIVSCFDSKYTYVLARPSHVDSEVQPLIPVPPHPSYPSAHSCGSNAMAHVFAHFFPYKADEALQMARDAGQSRILGGIHYQVDNTAGLEIGEKVAGVIIEKLQDLTN